MGSEDFAYMLDGRPGTYFFLGSRVTGEESRCTIPATTSTTTSCRSAPPSGRNWRKPIWKPE